MCVSRNITQRDEIARVQLDNGVLQEKLINEKRKVALLEVKLVHLSLFASHYYDLTLLECRKSKPIGIR